jgi:hypothetical protein
MNTPQLWQHRDTGARYLVMLHEGVVVQADGPLDSDELAAVQQDENKIHWSHGIGQIIEQRRNEYVRVFPQGE